MSSASLSDVVSQRDDDWAPVQRITLSCPEPHSETLYWFPGASTTQADDFGWESYWRACEKNSFWELLHGCNLDIVSKLVPVVIMGIHTSYTGMVYCIKHLYFLGGDKNLEGNYWFLTWSRIIVFLDNQVFLTRF